MTYLDLTDLELLIILQEKPMANDSTLARITGLSSPTIKRRIQGLYASQNGNKPAIERIQALLNYDALHLRIAMCFIEIPNENLDQVSKKLDDHPYIYYKIHCYGQKNGIHASFRIPENGISALKDDLEKLKDDQIIQSYELVADIYEEVRSKPRFIVYSTKDNTWDFNFKNWSNITYERLTRGLEENVYVSVLENSPDITELDRIDVEILSILSLNSRIKNVDILEKLSTKISPQRLSDRMRYLKKHFITGYRVYLNWEEIFNFLGFIFVCSCSQEVKDFFKLIIKYRPPPFETTLRITNSGFVLYAICPPSHMLDLLNVIYNKISKFSLYFLDYKTSDRYQLNVENYNFDTHIWKT